MKSCTWTEYANGSRSRGEAEGGIKGLADSSTNSMAKELPVVPAGFPCTIESLAAEGDFPIEGWVWPQSARRQERAGKLRAITDSLDRVIAWQRIPAAPAMYKEPVQADHSKAMPILDRSQCTISLGEMDAYAGRNFKGGRSRTKNLSEMQRVKRAREFQPRSLTQAEILAGRRQKTAPPPMEDFVERVEAKVEAFGAQRHAC